MVTEIFGIDNTYVHYLVYLLVTLLLALLLNNSINVFRMVKTYRFQTGYFKKFPGPKSHWLFGNLGDIPAGKNFLRRIEMTKQFGSRYRLKIGPYYRQLTLSDPESIRLLLNHADPKDSLGYGFIKAWLGDGLLISKGKKWARNRRLLTPSFHFNILKPYQKIFSDSAKIMMKKWRRQLQESPDKSLEMFECVSLMTLDSLMKCIFGIDEDFQVFVLIISFLLPDVLSLLVRFFVGTLMTFIYKITKYIKVKLTLW